MPGRAAGSVTTRRARRLGRWAGGVVVCLIALGLTLAATPGGVLAGSGAAYRAVQTRSTLAGLRREMRYPLQLPAYLPPGAHLTETTTTLSQSEGQVAKLHYRVPTPTGEVGLIVHQSHPEHPFRLVIPPQQVLDRPQIGAHEGLLYAAGTPPTGPPLLILAWDDGAYHLELWAGLPAEELIAVARSVRPEH